MVGVRLLVCALLLLPLGGVWACLPHRGHDHIAQRLADLGRLSRFWRDSLEVEVVPPVEPDLVLEYRIAELNRHSIIPLRHHALVRKYIEIFTQERRAQVAQMMGLSELYFPIFREALDRNGLPLELVYLAVIESALNPLAVSKSGATGLWQFKMNTVSTVNLSVDSFVDDRMDPYLSTEAACVYLKYLYSIFDDWPLALAAYNIGPGAVRRAIIRAGGERDFWRLLPSLPEAARNYIPAFIAINYVFHHAKEHALEPMQPCVRFENLDTVHVRRALSFRPLAEWTGVSVELLYFLNPRFRAGYVPKSSGEPYVLNLPDSATIAFAKHAERIYAQSHKVQETPFLQQETKSMRYYHVVQAGEFLHRIAIRFACTVDEIQRWNPRARQLHPGDSITIWMTPESYARIVGDSENP